MEKFFMAPLGTFGVVAGIFSTIVTIIALVAMALAVHNDGKRFKKNRPNGFDVLWSEDHHLSLMAMSWAFLTMLVMPFVGMALVFITSLQVIFQMHWYGRWYKRAINN